MKFFVTIMLIFNRWKKKVVLSLTLSFIMFIFRFSVESVFIGLIFYIELFHVSRTYYNFIKVSRQSGNKSKLT